MSLMQGYESVPNPTAAFYDCYSFGQNLKAFLEGEWWENNLKIIETDMRIAGVWNQRKDITAMDVGTGRQALAFARHGVPKIDHYDICPVTKSAVGASDDPAVTTTICDLCGFELPREKYDFVYLAGIVQHFSNTATGLRNCALAVKPGGRIWVYHYRGGTWRWFVMSMVRRLLSAADCESYFRACSQLFNQGDTATINLVTWIIDDIFVPYCNLFPTQDYIEFMRRLGFEIASSAHADPITRMDLDRAHHAAVLVFERIASPKVDSATTGWLLQPDSEIDYLNPTFYTEEKIRTALDLFRKLPRLTEPERYGLCMALHKLSAPHYYGKDEFPPDKDGLIKLLESAQ